MHTMMVLSMRSVFTAKIIFDSGQEYEPSKSKVPVAWKTVMEMLRKSK